MSISSEELDVLQNKVVLETSSDKYVLSQDYEKILRSSEYKVLGFLNDYYYSLSDGYLEKNTADGVAFASVPLDVEHASFHEQSNVFYAYKEKNLYCLNKNLEILWSKKCYDAIQSVKVDFSGTAYVLYRNLCSYTKIRKDGTEIMTVSESYDSTKKCTAYTQYLNSNCNLLYIMLTIYDELKEHLVSYLDIYDTYSGKRIDSIQKDSTYTSTYYSCDFDYKNLKISDEYMYYMTYSKIIKNTIHGLNNIGDNWEVNLVDKELYLLEYDDSDASENIYYCGNMSNGYFFGKMTSNGNTLWDVLYNNDGAIYSKTYADFRLCLYKKLLYTTSKNNISNSSSYVLSLNNGGIVLESRNGVLIKVSEVGYDDIYSSENYTKAYMIADKLKDDVERVKDLPLGYKYGIFRTSDNRLILMRKKVTEFAYDDYEYSKLKYVETAEYTDSTIILTNNDIEILTKEGSLIETKEPYNYDTIDKILASLYGEKYISTLSEKEIQTLRSTYINTGYILADKFKFMEYLVTKKYGDTIITKKKGFAIKRKMKKIYKYVFKRLNEIDVIVEYLIQNGVEKTTLPKYIDRLRHHTTSMIESIQVSKVPSLYNIGGSMKFYYYYDGTRYKINDGSTQIYKCTNIPYYPSNKYKIYMDSMINLVEEREIRPFLLFINGRAIKWSDMTIIKDWKDSYIIVRNMNNNESSYTLSSILFPCSIRYGEDSDVIPYSDNAVLLGFDDNGYYTTNIDDIRLRIEVTDSSVACSNIAYRSSEAIQIKTDYGKIASEKNVIMFRDNILNTELNDNLVNYGNNIFKFNSSISDIDSVAIKSYYFTGANISENIIYNFPNESVIKKDTLTNANNPRTDTNYINDYITRASEFDFKLYRDRTWSRNVSQSLKYIMGYDMALLIDFYKDQYNMKSFTYTGKKIVDLMDNKSPEYGANLVMPRLINNGLDDYVMVLYNNKLYEWYKQLEYRTREFWLPIFDMVSIVDQVEIVHFKNVNNINCTITVTEDTIDYISENLRYDNFLLYANSPTGSEQYGELSVENSMQFAVGFEYENTFDSNGKYTGTYIKLDDPYYYGKELNLVSKRQFRYMHYDINASNIRRQGEQYYLSPDFKFCHNPNQYMIFINQRKIRKNEWTLNTYNSFTDEEFIGITLSMELEVGDELEVFYLPDSYEEIDIPLDKEGVQEYGDICVDVDDLGYPFDKELAFIFADGMKINPDNITNVSIQKVLVSKITEITQNENPSVHICKFMDADETLRKVFSYSDMWSDSIKQLTSQKYKELFNKK